MKISGVMVEITSLRRWSLSRARLVGTYFQFIFDISKVDLVQKAKDRAKSDGKSFSKYILELIEADSKKKDTQQFISIISKEYQPISNEKTHFLFRTPKEKIELWKYIDACDEKELTDLAIQVVAAHGKIRERQNFNFRVRRRIYHPPGVVQFESRGAGLTKISA